MAFAKCHHSAIKIFSYDGKICCRNYFDIILVKVILTTKNAFTLFQALSRGHSCSTLVT